MCTQESLRATLGPNMTRAHKYIAQLLKSHPLNEPFDCPTLRSLVEFCPGRRFKIDAARGFVKAKRRPYNTVCLYAVLTPSDRLVDVSWLKAIKALYGLHKPEVDDKQKSLSAFRNEASKSPRMRSARAKFTVGPCADCGRRTKLVIDHAGMPFAQIVYEFLSHQGLALGDIGLKYGNGAHSFQPPRLSREWRTFHDAHAGELAGLCARCNCAKGSGGYKHAL